MPRRTHSHFLKTHHQLKHLWQSDQRVFAELSFTDQRALHDYYVFTVSLTDNELRQHRERVTAEQPSLPQRAGRALKRFEIANVTRVQLAQQYARTRVRAGGSGKVTIRAVAKPTIDVKQLARVFLDLADQLRRKEDQ